MKKKCNRLQKRACYKASCPKDCLARKAETTLTDPLAAHIKALVAAPKSGQAA